MPTHVAREKYHVIGVGYQKKKGQRKNSLKRVSVAFHGIKGSFAEDGLKKDLI